MRWLFLPVCAMTALLLTGCPRPRIEKMSLEEYRAFCLAESGPTCQSACGAVGAALTTRHPTAQECRIACDKAGNAFLLDNSMSECASATDAAVRLCVQYCDGKYPAP